MEDALFMSYNPKVVARDEKVHVFVMGERAMKDMGPLGQRRWYLGGRCCWQVFGYHCIPHLPHSDMTTSEVDFGTILAFRAVAWSDSDVVLWPSAHDHVFDGDY